LNFKKKNTTHTQQMVESLRKGLAGNTNRKN